MCQLEKLQETVAFTEKQVFSDLSSLSKGSPEQINYLLESV